MVKGRFSFVLLLIILLLILGSFIVESKQAKVENKVIKALNSEEKVSVLVLLKEGKNFNLASVSGVNKRTVEVGFNQNGVLSSLSQEGLDKEDFEVVRKFALTNGLALKVTQKGLEKLEKHPLVEKVFLDEPLHLALEDTIPIVNADDVWPIVPNGVNLTGEGEAICLIDTGVDYTHPALGGCSQADFLAGDCSPIVAGHDFVNDDADPFDDQGHGSHCAGIILSQNSVTRGVAPDVNIVAIKACGDGAGVCTQPDIISAIDWCVANASLYNISVISMSLGLGGEYNDSSVCDGGFLAAPINSAYGAGILTVVASGNDDYTEGIGYPACVTNATSVGATTKLDEVASYSNAGSLLDLLAPGGSHTLGDASTSVNSTVPTGTCTNCDSSGWNSIHGTSMATPHVAAAAAILIQYAKLENSATLTPSQIVTILRDNGVNKTDSRNSLVFPRLDIHAAILSQDSTSPTITFQDPTPENNSVSNADTVFINVTINDSTSVDSCWIEWDGTNATMNFTKLGTTLYCNSNQSLNGSGKFNYKVFGNDSSGNLVIGNLRILNNTYTDPEAVNVTMNSSDLGNYTNGTLTGYFDYLDVDNEAMIASETKWYNESALVDSLNNATSVGFNLTAKGETWKFSVRVYDGTNWSEWTNSSDLVVNNAPPVSTTIPDQNWSNESVTIDLSNYFSDVDSDNLSFGIVNNPENITVNQTGESVVLTQDSNFTGIRYIMFNATDGTLIGESNNITLNISDDLDGDGFASSTYGGTDCLDSNSNVNPNATEVCGNGIDDNCDGNVDEGCNTGGGSGGGGGGGSSSRSSVPDPVIYELGGEPINVLNLKSTDRIHFDFKQENHSIEIKEIFEDKVTLLIQSDPLEMNISVGEIKKLDIDNDGNNDLSLSLMSIIEEEIKLVVIEIDEPLYVLEEEPMEEDSLDEQGDQTGVSWTKIITLVVMWIIMIVEMFFIFKRTFWKKIKSKKKGKRKKKTKKK